MQYVAVEADEEPSADGQAAHVLVEIQIGVEGETYAGRARERDILPTCGAAYLDAIGNAEAVRRVRAEAMPAQRAEAA